MFHLISHIIMTDGQKLEQQLFERYSALIELSSSARDQFRHIRSPRVQFVDLAELHNLVGEIFNLYWEWMYASWEDCD